MAGGWRRRPGGRRHRRDVDELHADAQARGARDPRHEDDADLRVVSERMYDICEYLAMLHDRGELRTDFRPLPITVTYHAPCQQQGHGIGKPALDLLARHPSCG